jgi:hypothetical protein
LGVYSFALIYYRSKATRFALFVLFQANWEHNADGNATDTTTGQVFRVRPQAVFDQWIKPLGDIGH